MKKIYIILMNTRTIPSRLIKKFTRYKYSHVVLSLDSSYTKLYSMGRRTIHNFLNAGLVTDGIESDFFKYFNKTECLVYEITVTSEQYSNLKKILHKMEKNINYYHYDLKGLLLRVFYDSPKVRENYFVCTHFVATVLAEAGIYDFGKDLVKVRPIDFNNMTNSKKIYEGQFINVRD